MTFDELAKHYLSPPRPEARCFVGFKYRLINLGGGWFQQSATPVPVYRVKMGRKVL